MPTLDDGRPFPTRLGEWLVAIAVKAPRDRPDALLYVLVAACAFLLIAAVAALNGYLVR